MEDAYVINGGKKLVGHVDLSGAKNIALKAIIAALLFEGKVIINNVPQIRDVEELIHLLKSLGVKIKFIHENSIEIDSDSLKLNKLDFLHASKIRTSFLLFAPLLYRFGNAHIPNPGGCRIGARSIDRVVDGMRQLGIVVNYDSTTGYYVAAMKQKPSGSYLFSKPSHTATELLILLAVFGRGTIEIGNAALEPEIDNLMAFLNEAGASINRHGSKIMVKGVKKLVQKKPFTIASDRNEAITYAVLGLITGGDVTISSIEKHYIKAFVDLVKNTGGGVEQIEHSKWRFFSTGVLKSSQIITSPHPGFMTDWQPNWAVLMTQSSGDSLIHERVFENRFAYVEELKKLGAKIEFVDLPIADPKNFYLFNYDGNKTYHQAIKIYGKQKLHNGVLTVSDLRAGATLAIAALFTSGESVINGVSILERGYENFIGKVKNLGGNIKLL